MKNISLLPPEIRARQEAHRKSRALFLGGTVVSALFLVVYLVLFAVTWQAQVQLRLLLSEREALEHSLPAYQQYISLQQQVEQTDKLLKKAMGTPPDWAAILSGFGLHLPEGVWLTDLTLVYEPGDEMAQASPGSPLPVELPPAPPAPPAPGPETEESGVNLGAGSELTMRGAAKSHALVAEWLDGVRQVPGLAGVFCQFVGAEGEAEDKIIYFEIKAMLQPGAPYRPPEGVIGRAGAV